jgi:hypothetical protein
MKLSKSEFCVYLVQTYIKFCLFIGAPSEWRVRLVQQIIWT